MKIHKRVKELSKQGYSKEEIQKILFEETSKLYTLNTIKVYSRQRMDVDKDNDYMNKCRAEYQEKEVKDTLLDKMYLMASERGLIN